ncbi:hypothetical protein PC9H_008917 [Pleurotus ostreatus]|uniref:Uncharacterized protein n=2 Tax=Pleurotus ostreatus TaxID=5322 RepID=A0A8H6ZPQ3_PLEOS|nr:uncharacterized protein PC9H_008917 [Pleurotus ostreatus]KAF7426548.1 hypothetical protein PC9H_008917 [Pleurotus ostreatus]
MDGVRGSGCPGVKVDWRAGNIFTTFPWQMFQQKDTPFWLSHVAGHGDDWVIRIRSNRCNPRVNTNGTVCEDCTSTRQQRTFRNAEDRAKESTTPPHMNALYLTHDQLAAKLAKKGISIRDLQQTVRRRNSSLNSAHRAVTDHKRLLSAIATEDVNRMKHLVASGIRNCMSAKAILSNISNTIINLRTVKQYGQTDLDIAMLIRHYGGRKCLFAMSKALGLPSLSTLNRSAQWSPILPCTGDPQLPLLLANLEASFPCDISPLPTPSGYCLQIDGVAIRRNVRWIRRLDSIGGLCREHVDDLDISMRTHDTTMRTWEAVHGNEPTCHYGSEATVAVFGAFNGVDYEPRPVLVSATCNAEKAPEFASLVRLLGKAWDQNACGVYGALWCISTDGASTMRLGCHQVCTTHELDTTNPLFGYLGGLPGLNLACGADNVTYSSDPKHCIERIATLLRSKNGMMLNRQHINSAHLHSFLVLLDGEDDASVRTLIDPADHQNVPRAVKLMIMISMISTLKDSTVRPIDEPVLNVLLALNDLISAFLEPFINPILSLSEQLTSLAKFAHLAFVHHRLHGTSFMTNQLYADLQGVVKTAFFCVAKQKVLDRSKSFYLYQQGSDRLEQTFGTIRSMTHDQNVDIVQLCERLSDCVDVDKIFTKHPDWKRAHRRLSYTGTEGVDHVNPAYFTGNLVVDDVLLSGVWRSGRIEAELALRDRHIDFDLKDALRADDVNFLCPYGGRKFVGVTEEHDPSLDDATDPVPDVESVVTDTQESNHASGQHMTVDSTLSTSPTSDSVKDELTDDDIHLEDYIGDEPDQYGEVTTSEDIPADWLEVPTGNGSETKPIHKASVLACLFKSGVTKLSADRLSRVRGYTKDFKREEEAAESPMGEAILRVKDVVVSVVQTSDKVIAPVFVAVSSIIKNGKTVISATLDEMHSSEATGIHIAGQVLAADLCDFDGSTSLVWNGDYSSFIPPRANRKQPTAPVLNSGPTNGFKNCHLIDFPGHLVFPLNEGLVSSEKLPESLTKLNLEALGRKNTSYITLTNFDDLIATEFETVPLSAYQKLKNVGSAAGVPLMDSAAEPFVVKDATKALVTKQMATKSSKIDCHQCGKSINHTDGRGHASEHILLKLAGLKEQGLREEISDVLNACGFCGKGTCGTTSMKPHSKMEVASECPRAHPFVLGRAVQTTGRHPSTNVPVRCRVCPSEHPTSLWKYSMFLHIKLSHPHLWDHGLNQPKNLPSAFLDDLRVSQQELSYILKSRPTIRPNPDTPPAVSLPFNPVIRGLEEDLPKIFTFFAAITNVLVSTEYTGPTMNVNVDIISSYGKRPWIASIVHLSLQSSMRQF